MNELNNSDNLDYSAPPRSFIVAVKVCLAKFAVFKGRASRSEFWWFFLFKWLCDLAILIGGITLTVITAPSEIGPVLTGLAQIIFTLVIITPYCAVGVRRFHDINRSGAIFISLLVAILLSALLFQTGLWYEPLFLMLVALICTITVFWMSAAPAKKQRNKYNLPTDVGREIT